MVALAFVSAWGFILLVGDASHGLKRFALQFFIWCVIGIYFVWSWTKKGQTLPMRSWQLKLVNQPDSKASAELLSTQKSMLRYALATLSFMLLGIGFLWRLVDRDQLFLHDRLLGTRIVSVSYLRSTK